MRHLCSIMNKSLIVAENSQYYLCREILHLRMKNSLLLLLLMPVALMAQSTIEEYKASNSITYHIGDTIKLGRGSTPTGDFAYFQVGGVMTSTSTDLNANNTGRIFSGSNVVIKKIREYNKKGAQKVLFVVGAGTFTNYNLWIEDAIATCEIEDCKKIDIAEKSDNLDRLIKLKKLLDSGAITQNEYDAEKKKILNN